MKKIIIFMACLMVLMLAGCENELSLNPNPSITPEVVEPTAPPTVTNLPVITDATPDYILGTWTISYAENGNTGENYPLYEFYGTGLEYGGNLTLNTDATFKRYIGITTEETDRYEGTYSVKDDVITFNFNNGTISTAKYLPSSKEIEYYTEDTNQIPINEYYIKK
jgi:hypothetical protein